MLTKIASGFRPLLADELKFKRWMPGASGACLAEASNGQQWVVKLLHNRQGSRLLANELMGAVLLRSLGLPSLPWRHFRLSGIDWHRIPFRVYGESFRFNEDETHFASLYVGEPNFLTMPLAICPEEEDRLNPLMGLFVFDLWAAHADRREVILAYDRQSDRTHTFAIDNGHLFYGPEETAISSESTGVYLTRAMRAAVIRPESLGSIMDWVTKMQTVLPRVIENQLRRYPVWGPSALITDVAHFRDRLHRLPSLVRVELERQVNIALQEINGGQLR